MKYNKCKDTSVVNILFAFQDELVDRLLSIKIINDLPTHLGKQIVCIQIPILLIRSP